MTLSNAHAVFLPLLSLISPEPRHSPHSCPEKSPSRMHLPSAREVLRRNSARCRLSVSEPPPHPKSYVEVLTLKAMVLGGGHSGVMTRSWLGLVIEETQSHRRPLSPHEDTGRSRHLQSEAGSSPGPHRAAPDLALPASKAVETSVCCLQAAQSVTRCSSSWNRPRRCAPRVWTGSRKPPA